MIVDWRRFDLTATETEALQALAQLQIKWESRHPVIARSWQGN